MEQSETSRIEDCLSLARICLIRARIQRQEADVITEFERVHGHGTVVFGEAVTKYKLAKSSRNQVKLYLLAAESLIGKRWFQGRSFVPLKEALNGSKFREWGEYAQQYRHNPLFRGEDPE